MTQIAYVIHLNSKALHAEAKAITFVENSCKKVLLSVHLELKLRFN